MHEQSHVVEQIQKKYRDLQTRKVQVDTQLESAQRELDVLTKRAREEFGADSEKELSKQLQQIEKYNGVKAKVYQQELEKIEAALSTVEASE